MRILFVSRSTPLHQIGGMEIVSWELARKLAELGHDVTFLTTSIKDRPANFEHEDVKLRCVNAPGGKYSLRWWIRSYSAVKADGSMAVPDVLFSISAGAFSVVNLVRCPIKIAQIHGTSLAEIRSKLRERRIISYIKALKNLGWLFRDVRYRMFNGLVAIGPKVASDLSHPITRFITGERPIFTIQNGIDAAFFRFDEKKRSEIRRRYSLCSQTKVIISVSRLHSQKGVYQSIQAVARASEVQKVRYFVVGDGDERPTLEKYVVEEGLTDTVTFLGALTRLEISHWLSAADVFLFTTLRKEGLPTNVLEALAAGLPTILSREALDERFTAIGVDPTASEEVARTICEIQTGLPRESLLGEEFSIAHTTSQYLDLFRSKVVVP